MTINIYSPEFHHESGCIAGDREGLEKLKRLIEIALESGKASTDDFDSDGEEFEVRVLLDPAIQTRDAPYKNYGIDPWWNIGEVWNKSYE